MRHTSRVEATARIRGQKIFQLSLNKTTVRFGAWHDLPYGRGGRLLHQLGLYLRDLLLAFLHQKLQHHTTRVCRFPKYWDRDAASSRERLQIGTPAFTRLERFSSAPVSSARTFCTALTRLLPSSFKFSSDFSK